MIEQTQPEKIDTLLFFGSFDPFTVGHAHVVGAGLTQVRPKQGIMIIPAWKAIWGKNMTASADRQAMIKLTIKANPVWEGKVTCSSVEQEQQLSGRTLETLSFLISSNPQTHYGIILGSDSLTTFDKWYRWEEILHKVPLYVVLRNHDTKEELVEKLEESLRPYIDDRIKLLEHESEEARHISATEVRSEIKVHGRSLWVVPEVLAYIQQNKLYLTS